MVLGELGNKLRSSLRRLHTSSSINEEELNSLLSEITRALIEADVQVQLVMKMRDNVKQRVLHLLHETENTNSSSFQQPSSRNLAKMVERAIVDEMTSLLSPSTGDSKNNLSKSKKGSAPYKMKKGRPNVILFVGLQGAGKTTTIGKFANYYQKRGWKTAMVCADTFRAGAFDQLKQNATKLRIPFYGSYTQADPVLIAEQGVAQFVKDKYEVIIVDTSGRHKQESALFEEMQEISASIEPDNTILVMDATQGQAVHDQAVAFNSAVEVGSVIVTKLDGHAKGGGALSAVAATGSSILFLGSGEHFDDLEPFNAESFVSKLLGFGDVRGLMEAMKSVTDKKEQQEMMQKMEKGVFTLRMMYSQLEKMLNLGPMSKVMGMIPGIPDSLMPKGSDDASKMRLKRFCIIMDSMTDAELDGLVDLRDKLNPETKSRIRRIAAGSGSHPDEVRMLLIQHKQFEGMISSMGKSGMIGKGAQQKQQQALAQMRKNPALAQQRLNQMDPRMLQQMGGREAVMNMIRNGGAGGGANPPDFSSLLNSAGGGMPNLSSMMGNPAAGGGMPGVPPGMDMESLAKMAQAMGMAPPGVGRNT